ncbi:MAG: uroporphyrinogen decarboxylase family protein, partial [Treponema sp.]|nr:uroporphyrinogen decarboxylase family protein [Treponema sp.]
DAKGMDPRLLKNRWGGKISFHGGVSVQKTLPFGSIDDVRAEVRERIAVLGKGGGYILAPSHAVQGGTPPQNILAFLEEAGRPLQKS